MINGHDWNFSDKGKQAYRKRKRERESIVMTAKIIINNWYFKLMNLLHSSKQARLTFQHDNDCYKWKQRTWEKCAFLPIKTHTDCRHHSLLLKQDPFFSLFKHSLLSESKTDLSIHSTCTIKNKWMNFSE